MIVIFSRSNDASTSDVVEWLESLNENVVRINEEEISFQLHKIDLDKNEIIIKNNDDSTTFNLLKVKSIWYRKGGMFFNFFNLFRPADVESIFFDFNSDKYIMNLLKSEISTIRDYVFNKISKQGPLLLGNYVNRSPNKLLVLEIAKSIGLNIPASYILNESSSVMKILHGNKKLVTKAISDGVYFFAKNNAYYSFTEEVDGNSLGDDPLFLHSLFQVKIEKKYEVRSFFMNNDFYSMAIFSQNNSQTQVDYRKYDQTKPNRCVPYNLPEGIESKLRELMRLLSQNTGSIDLIVDKDDKFWFLEVNPVGQFGMVSIPCNYHLELKIANYLKYGNIEEKNKN